MRNFFIAQDNKYATFKFQKTFFALITFFTIDNDAWIIEKYTKGYCFRIMNTSDREFNTTTRNRDISIIFGSGKICSTKKDIKLGPVNQYFSLH